MSAALSVGMAVPAGANTPVNPNPDPRIVTGSGSNTTYTMMQQLSTLYSSVPGCDQLAASGTQQLDFSCPDNPDGPAPGGENGYTLGYPSPNPYNVDVTQMPAYGSSNGIKQLEFQGGDSLPGVSVWAPSFARSSRAANLASDKSGLNFVAYAEDAVPWFHYLTVNGTNTPSNAVTDLSVSQLNAIYSGSTTDWGAVGGTSGQPIDVFMAQNGSGTEGTWVSALGLTGSYPYGGATATAARTGLPVSDYEVFENEVDQLFATGEEANAMFFFSYGKYTLLCPSGKCAGVPAKDGNGTAINQSATTAALGTINGIAASQTTIQDGSFPLDRSLYNVYSDGSNPNIPAAAPAVLAFASTYGFLCNPQTNVEVDPLSPTKATYRGELNTILRHSGFFPVPFGVMGDSSVVTPSFETTRSVTDGVATSGSTTISSATAGFRAQDVGKQVSGAGITAGSKIVSVTDANDAVLSLAAFANETGDTVTITAVRTITDASYTFGNTLITSATAHFTAADVGDIVSGPGIAPNTVITAVKAADRVQTNRTARQTQSGATVTFGSGNDYANADQPPGGDNGYCRVTTTDGDGNT